MSTHAEAALESGWALEGTDGAGQPLRLVFGDTELSRAYLGVAIGRHGALCERVIEDGTVSRRHLRVGAAEGRLFVEDLNSLNGTLVDGAPIRCFEPMPVEPGQMLTLGRVNLTIARLADRGGGR
jgi:pSer/pThr/pTyr-binding forkhead associated (FHA) protein